MPELRTNNMPFKVGQTIIVTGIPDADAADKISMNFGPNDKDIALHINLQFSTNTAVYNSYEGGVWGQEVFGKGFPFKQGVTFSIAITFTFGEFVITLPDDRSVHFPNRLGGTEYTEFFSDGKIRIESLMVKQ
ncbi:beta-galactoside-binding lectin-like isoform 1-T1 [Synchiropus picturatus]